MQNGALERRGLQRDCHCSCKAKVNKEKWIKTITMEANKQLFKMCVNENMYFSKLQESMLVVTSLLQLCSDYIE